jgi:hypothetical protein
MSPVGSSLRRLELQRAIAKGHQTRERWALVLDTAREDHAAVDEAWRQAEMEMRAAADTLGRAKQAAPWAQADYGHLGDALAPRGQQPPEWANEYAAWVRAKEQRDALNVPLAAAESRLRTAETALAAADKQLVDWQAELAELERSAIHGTKTYA